MKVHLRASLSPPGLLAAAVLLTAAAAWLWAHEGHESLPTRGLKVDVIKGLLFLSPEVRQALDVQTAEVVQQSLEERLAAPATLVAPWQRHAFASARLGGKVIAIHVQPGQTVREIGRAHV